MFPGGLDTTTSLGYPQISLSPPGDLSLSPFAQRSRILVVRATPFSCQAGAYAKDGEALSPRSRAINEWFADWDRDDSGSISRDDLEKGLHKLGIVLSEVKTKDLFFSSFCLVALEGWGGRGGGMGGLAVLRNVIRQISAATRHPHIRHIQILEPN